MSLGEFMGYGKALGAVGNTGSTLHTGIGFEGEPGIKLSGFIPVEIIQGIALETKGIGDGDLLNRSSLYGDRSLPYPL